MYRFICLLIVLISMFLRLPAQEHAVFLGLPLGGNVEEFVEELQDKGYEVRIRSQNIISLTGMFDGVQCIIEVHHTPKSLVVHQVSVAFAEFMENDIARMLKYRQIRTRRSTPSGITPVGKHSTNGHHLTREYHSARSVSRGRASRLCSYGGKIAKGGRGPKPRDYDACRKLEGYFLRNCSFFCNFAFGTKQ